MTEPISGCQLVCKFPGHYKPRNQFDTVASAACAAINFTLIFLEFDENKRNAFTSLRFPAHRRCCVNKSLHVKVARVQRASLSYPFRALPQTAQILTEGGGSQPKTFDTALKVV